MCGIPLDFFGLWHRELCCQSAAIKFLEREPARRWQRECHDLALRFDLPERNLYRFIPTRNKGNTDPNYATGSVFQGWNGVYGGTSECALTLSSSQVVAATFATEKLNPPPTPDIPFLVKFQPPASQTPTKFKKDNGSVFTNNRSYGWNQLFNGTERNSTADQTLDTFVSATNLNPGTWSFAIPNGTYYVTKVLGDHKNAQGPHWVQLRSFH